MNMRIYSLLLYEYACIKGCAVITNLLVLGEICISTCSYNYYTTTLHRLISPTTQQLFLHYIITPQNHFFRNELRSGSCR